MHLVNEIIQLFDLYVVTFEKLISLCNNLHFYIYYADVIVKKFIVQMESERIQSEKLTKTLTDKRSKRQKKVK